MSDSAYQRGPLLSGPRQWMARAALIMVLIAGGAWWAYGRAPQAPDVLAGVNPWPLVALFFALLAGSAFVASSETALFSLDKLDLSQLRNATRWRDRLILRLLGRPNDTLITIMILNNVFNISAALTAGAFMDRLVGHASKHASALSFTLAALAASTGILLFGEILPKVLAHLNPPRAARLLAIPLSALAELLLPLRALLGWLLKGILALLRIPAPGGGEEVSEEELKVMISSGEVSSVLEQDEREMIDGVFDLRRTVASEILTPRMAVTAVADDLTQEAMVRALKECPNNRVLVYHETLDHPSGFLLVKQVLLDERGNWRDHLREALLVPEGVGLLDLLKTFRAQRTKMAVVVDEYGGVAGIVTLQDLLEEIVGDIYEKHEHIEREINELGEGRWRVAGSANLAALGEVCAVSFPGDRGRTVGGFIMNTLGRIPKVGDEVLYESLILAVEGMAGRRLNSVLVRRLSVPEPAAAREERA